ncbi:hypothetical protein [Azospirillum picis]|uniref:Uncharacterized protein n=1 Tax=Azospirillum picis TaxID=488438 RepID=A0ABU0MEL7_9PROT|nr:hypothetical protein [Azospirillum picis]MBP2297975.1 hypothetical protein [Azospirillum picis]MDQ0531813.1 hypothetical protein [Azospirillum picis]
MSATLNAFLRSACEGREASVHVRVSHLYGDYTRFCAGHGVQPVQRKKFARLLRKEGLTVTLDDAGITWVRGIVFALELPSGLDQADRDALRLIALELARQRVGEGFTAAHDGAHDPGDLEMAGGCYLLNAGTSDKERADFPAGAPCDLWPWENRWWKPASRVRDAVRGSALGAAGIATRLRAGERAEG